MELILYPVKRSDVTRNPFEWLLGENNVTVDLVIFSCLDFRVFVIWGLLPSLQFANYRFR